MTAGIESRKSAQSRPDTSTADVSFADVSMADISIADISIADVSIADVSIAGPQMQDLPASPGSSLPTRMVPMRTLQSTPPAASDWYEERKRDLIMAALPRRYYQLAVEPGCGTGGITAALAERCNRVLAWDRDPDVLQACRERVGPAVNVEIRLGSLPEDCPPDTADLIVLSEIGYHLEPAEFDDLVTRACAGLAVGGTLIAAHRRATADRFELGGDDVHAHLFGRIGLSRVGGYADDELRIDVFVSEPPLGLR